jgi:hypothetical protein
VFTVLHPSVNLVAGLQSYFRDGRMLTATELRRVTEIFTKMFMDAHTKVETPFFFYKHATIEKLRDLCEGLSSEKDTKIFIFGAFGGGGGETGGRAV